ncbi:MAG: hypothetical protein HQL72_04030 [Magnetococcales bacterium]|nr:hypothetical protein [Magnetococcales bacterium]
MEEGGSDSNVLFQNYGGIVDSFFADSKEAGDPIAIVPPSKRPIREPAEQQKKPLYEFPLENSEAEADYGQPTTDDKEPPILEGSAEASKKNASLIMQFVPKDAYKKTQEMVDSFRRILRKKPSTILNRNQKEGSEEEQLLFSYLKDFRRSLHTGEEALLETNPFYELAKQIYKLSLDGISNAFQDLHKNAADALPKPIPVSESLRSIWRRSGPGRGLLDKIAETFGKGMAFGRTPFSLLLFAGSTYTTARGVNDLLQMSEVAGFFGEMFDGRSGEGNRYMVCLASGLILSSAILDYKTKIFQSIVESGSVLSGIRDAFLRSPRWMIIASLLTFVSIKTNYDGIVSIISKKEDLAQQSLLITSRVRKALGSPFFMNPLEPDSLFDLQGLFQQTTKEMMEVFLALPEDEVKGVASSGDPRKGPRYWAKHFIVHGGYEEGINDVKLSYNNQLFAQRIDDMLKNSGIDFSSSYSQKVESLRNTYENHLRETDELVRKRLGELNVLMSMGGYSLDEIKRVLAIEHYQINDIVEIVVSALEANKQAYKEISEDLGELTKSYVDILQQVDKSGTSGLSAYHIKADVVVPKIEAIDQLRAGKIPIAKHKNFAELRASLMQRYGVSLGSMLLAAILFFSISMDLGDPIVFSRMTARRGKKDRVFFKDRLEKLKVWEEFFFQRSEVFFQEPDVRAVFMDTQSPGDTMIRNAFYKLLEEINPELRDTKDKSLYLRFDHWFRGMFRFSRTTDMAGLNNRLKTIQHIIKKRNRYFQQWGVLIYPDFQVDKSFSKCTFQEWQERAKTLLNERRVSFYQELRDAVQEHTNPLSELPKDLSPAQKRLTSWTDKKGMGLLAKLLAWSQRSWTLLFETSFKEPIPEFSYTRRGWLQDFSENSLESEKIVESIYGFIPDLKKVVFETLPSIQEEYLEPVLDFLSRYPGYESSNDFLNRESLQKQFDEIEKEALDLWGVSFFASDDPGGYLGLSSIIGQEELSNLQEIVEKTGTDSVVFSRKVSELAHSMKRAHQFVTTAEEMNRLFSEVRTYCVAINQSLMKIKMRAWEYRGSGGVGDGFLDTARDLQHHAPKEADSILSVMEAILQSEEPYTRTNLMTLRDLKQNASDLQDRIMAFVDFGTGDDDDQSAPSSYPSAGQQEYSSQGSSNYDENDHQEEEDFDYSLPPGGASKGSETQRKESASRWAEQEKMAHHEVPFANHHASSSRELGDELEATSGGEDNFYQEQPFQQIGALYETRRGVIYQGEAEQISLSGLEFNSTTDPSMLPIGNEGTVQLTVGEDAYQFIGKVVRVSGSLIIIRILHDQEQFEAFVQQLVKGA